MIKVAIYYKDYNNINYLELNNLKPRRYMLNWDFKKLLKYIKNTLIWRDININDVVRIQLFNPGYWFQNFYRE